MSNLGVQRTSPSRNAKYKSQFTATVLSGLSESPKSLPPRLFYDARGSELFEAITRLPEYYPTRTEVGILRAQALEIADGVPDAPVLIELGSGSSTKSEIIIAALPKLSAYVPVDVSQSALNDAAARLRTRFPQLDVRPVVGDFHEAVALPADIAGHPRVGFFPGSTIGNSTPAEATRLLRHLRTSLLRGGRLIIGVDLKKAKAVLERAYNDTAGVTSAFNLNVLSRINREIEPAFDLATFEHKAIYNTKLGRIEMHLVSRESQVVNLAGHAFYFDAGESIHTENSYKYSIAEFHQLCQAAGWVPRKTWTDPAHYFSLHELVVSGSES